MGRAPVLTRAGNLIDNRDRTVPVCYGDPALVDLSRRRQSDLDEAKNGTANGNLQTREP